MNKRAMREWDTLVVSFAQHCIEGWKDLVDWPYREWTEMKRDRVNEVSVRERHEADTHYPV